MRGPDVVRLVVVGLVAALTACTREEHVLGRTQTKEEQAAAACPEYVAGTNMLGVEWSDEADKNADVADLVQIAGDASAASTRVNTELYDACATLANAVGTGPKADASPSLHQTERACDGATAGLATFRGIEGNPIATITADSLPCAIAGAITSCLADCGDDATCDDYCGSASAWMADCPAADVTITFDREVAPDLQERWNAVEDAVGRVLAARGRLGLANQTLLGLGYITPDSYSFVDSDCLSVVLQSLTDTNEANASANQTIGDLLREIQVAETD